MFKSKNILFLVFSIFLITTSASFSKGTRIKEGSPLCQSSKPLILDFYGSRFNPNPQINESLVVTTWNTHKFDDQNFFKDLEKISESSDLLLIQEGLHDPEIQSLLSSQSDKQFNFFKSFCSNSQATGVLTATRLPQLSATNIVSEKTEPISNTPKVTGYSFIEFQGQKVHLLNTHALNFNTGSAFEKQVDQVSQFIKTLQGPIIWAGDFNTWSKTRTDYLLKKTKELNLSHLQPTQDPRNLKLDHLFVRGFTASKVIVREEKSSDHFPIEATLKLIE